MEKWLQLKNPMADKNAEVSSAVMEREPKDQNYVHKDGKMIPFSLIINSCEIRFFISVDRLSFLCPFIHICLLLSHTPVLFSGKPVVFVVVSTGFQYSNVCFLNVHKNNVCMFLIKSEFLT